MRDGLRGASENHQVRFTLDPLRTDGADSLDATGLEGISRITLLEIEAAWDDEFATATIRKSDDIFGCAEAEEYSYDPIPRGGRLVNAVFLVEFEGSAEQQIVRVRPPGTLRFNHDRNRCWLENCLLKRALVCE